MRRDDPTDETSGLTPARALLHPAWLAALGVLVLNDHVLKDVAALAPLTGKLSDVAGLFLAPVLLATLLRVRRKRELIASAGLVGAVFAAINLSPAAAGVWDQAMAAVGFPWTTYTDPTDCLTLVMLPVSVAFFDGTMRTGWQSPRRRIAALVLAGVGTLACAGSTGPGPGPDPEPVPVTNQFQSRVALLNKTHELQIVQIRKLADDVSLDCDRVAEAPQEYLRADVFGDPVRWELASGQQIGLSGNVTELGSGNAPSIGQDDCRAARIVIDIAPDIVVFWDGSLEPQQFVQHPEGAKEDLGGTQTVALAGDYSNAVDDDVGTFGEGPCVRNPQCAGEDRRRAASIPEGAEYAWEQGGDDRLFWEIPNRNERARDEVPRRCRQDLEQPGLAWEALPEGDRVVDTLDRGNDGCHRLALARPSMGDEEPEPTQHIVCAPWESMRHLAPREGTRTTVTIEELSGGANAGGIAFDIEVVDDQNRGASKRVKLLYGTALDRLFPAPASTVPKEGCGPIEAKCGQMDVPAEITFDTEDIDDTTVEGTFPVGDTAQFGPSTELHVVRAFQRSVLKASSECEDDPFIKETMPAQTSSYIEAAIVETDQRTR